MGETPNLPDPLMWMADAPLFIDENQIGRFFDAVVRPEGELGKTTVSFTEEQQTKIAAKLGTEAKVEPGALAGMLAPVFAFVKPSVSVNAAATAESDSTRNQSQTHELLPIQTPQRRLVELAIHYLVSQTDRLFLVDDPAQPDWRHPETISAVPRSLTFLNLPPGTKFIPTAAEFEDGTIQQLFSELKADGEEPPKYPDTGNDLLEQRKKYWKWFDEKFSSTQAMIVVENAASEHGRIRWIDYRLPITEHGDTLHLHVCPNEQYHTGVFAYNFIKRGEKHGMRLVGTLKSEPDMNVLAIYER